MRLLIQNFAGFCILGCVACGQRFAGPPLAVGGILDLRGQDLSSPVELNGQWQFYWQEIKLPGTANADVSAQTSIAPLAIVPGIWNQHTDSPQTGFATFRLRVLLPESPDGLALRIPVQGSALTGYWNEDEIARAGSVATTASEEEIHYRPLYSEIPAATGEGILTIALSNHSNPRAGLRNAIQIGKAEKVFALRDQSRLTEAFLAGALLILGIYHLGLFCFRHDDPAPLWFALLCLTITVRTMLTGEHLLLEIFALDSPLVLRLKILTFYVSLLFLTLFFQSFFPVEFHRWITRAVIIGVLMAGAMAAFMPPSVYLHSVMPVQLLAIAYAMYALIRVATAIFSGRSGARLIILGCLLAFMAMANDILFTWFWRGQAHLAPYGLLALAITLALALSRRIAAAFEKSENLTRDLKLAYTNALNLQDRLRQSEKLATIGDMAAGIVHDLKNPVAVIKGYKEMADHDGLGREKRRHFLNIIDKEADRMLALVQDLLDFSRGSAAVAREWMGSKEFTERIKTVLDPLFNSREIEYSVMLDFVDSIYLDPERLLRAIINIAGNAADALEGKRGGRFILQISRSEDSLIFTMTDNGPGIPLEIRETLFEPFATHGKEHGTGLGMAIARNIVQAHGGSIDFKTSSSGTTFTIAMPAVQDPAAEETGGPL
ncbi:MAG: sensor histidine kinase [Spirochaetales bacterium]|nr:sensor histidine kinase [Spirochaetales bacterium]